MTRMYASQIRNYVDFLIIVKHQLSNLGLTLAKARTVVSLNLKISCKRLETLIKQFTCFWKHSHPTILTIYVRT